METVVLKINSLRPQLSKIKKAVEIIRAGGLVAFPTETVYGLGANFLDEKAIDRVYRIKKRDRNKPLTVHVADIKTVEEMTGRIPARAKRLMDKFWPGPLTLVLKDNRGGKTGFRMPDNRIAFLLLKWAKAPVVAPSANISGNCPPTTAKEVLRDLDGKIEMVIDGGKAKVGVASTVVDITGRNLKILRQGAVSNEKIQTALNKIKEGL